jgi:hypothetical protein
VDVVWSNIKRWYVSFPGFLIFSDMFLFGSERDEEEVGEGGVGAGS